MSDDVSKLVNSLTGEERIFGNNFRIVLSNVLDELGNKDLLRFDFSKEEINFLKSWKINQLSA